MRRQVSAACPLVGRSGQTPRGIPGQDRAGDALKHARPNRWGADRGRSSPACPDQGQALTGQGCCPAQDLSRQDEQQRNGTACMSSVTVPACDRAGRMSRPPDHGPQDELAVPNGPPRAYGTPQTSAGIAMRFGGRSGGSSTGAPPRLDLQTSHAPGVHLRCARDRGSSFCGFLIRILANRSPGRWQWAEGRQEGLEIRETIRTMAVRLFPDYPPSAMIWSDLLCPRPLIHKTLPQSCHDQLGIKGWEPRPLSYVVSSLASSA